mmetsp:Transcript_18849/g.55928  ORF Transcript_18849/g.55928 Transcript_18849/m.55928 type:complete len:360 (+) Transcript_18849:31-1110(+)
MDELSQYERDRNAKIARNQAFLASMGLGAAPAVPESTSAASRRPAPAPVPVPEASVAVTALRQTWPARAREAAALVAALAAPGDAPIIVSGPCAVGKTGLVSAAAAALGITCAWVNCGDAAVSAPRSWLVDRTCAGLDMVGSVCTGSGAAGARRAGPGTLTRRLAAAATASLRGRVVVVLDDCDRLLVRARRGATSSDNGAAAVRHLLVACHLPGGRQDFVTSSQCLRFPGFRTSFFTQVALRQVLRASCCLVTTGTLRLTPCASVTQFALHSRRTRHQARLLQSWRLLVRACARVCLEMMMLVPTAGLSVLLQQLPGATLLMPGTSSSSQIPELSLRSMDAMVLQRAIHGFCLYSDVH